MKSKKGKNFIKKAIDGGRYALKSVFTWFKRAFFRQETLNGIEKIESPARLLRENFFRKKAAVVSLFFFISLFLFVFIAPLFVQLDVNYTDPLQQNVAPTFFLRSPPQKLKRGVQDINGFSDFTVGLSFEGEVFVWGNTQDLLRDIDLKKFQKKLEK